MAKVSSIVLPSTLGRFVDGEERHRLAEDRVPLRITGVRDDDGHRYRGKPAPRWLFDLVDMTSGELLTLGLAKNTGRDMLAESARRLFEDGQEIDPVCLAWGESQNSENGYWTFADASDEEIAAAATALEAAESAPDDAEGEDTPPPAETPTLRKSRKAAGS